MPEGKFKSRTFRRVYKRTPGSVAVLTHVRRKPAKHKCAKCGTVLAGTARELPYKKLTLSQKRPTRPFGGYMCSSCTRKVLREKAR